MNEPRSRKRKQVANVKPQVKSTKDNEVQERATAVRSRRLMKEFQDMVQSHNSQPDPVFTVELVNDNLFEWRVKIHKIDPESDLAKDMRELMIPHIVLGINFPDTFPFLPPFVRVVEPKILGGFVLTGGAICMELLTPKGWTSSYTIEAVVMQFIATVVKGKGRISMLSSASPQEYSLKAAEAAFKFIVQTHDKYGWSTPAPSDGGHSDDAAAKRLQALMMTISRLVVVRFFTEPKMACNAIYAHLCKRVQDKGARK